MWAGLCNLDLPASAEGYLAGTPCSRARGGTRNGACAPVPGAVPIRPDRTSLFGRMRASMRQLHRRNVPGRQERPRSDEAGLPAAAPSASRGGAKGQPPEADAAAGLRRVSSAPCWSLWTTCNAGSRPPIGRSVEVARCFWPWQQRSGLSARLADALPTAESERGSLGWPWLRRLVQVKLHREMR